ncbi:MAG: hypothetical protein GX896_06155, partial [Clostridiales bacterium]|nr:hypothetical protein [Clostridiales bacterium]
ISENNSDSKTNDVNNDSDGSGGNIGMDFENASQIPLDLSKTSGIYQNEFSLSLTATGAKEIYYTTDGSDPRTSDSRILYEGDITISNRSGEANVVSAVDPILFSGNYSKVNKTKDGFVSTVTVPNDSDVDKCTTIRVSALDKEGLYTIPQTATYFIGTTEEHIQGLKESCEASGESLAVISISMEYDDLFDAENGIYVKGNLFDKALEEHLNSGERLEAETARSLDANYKQRGKAWERNAYVEMFNFDTSGVSTCFAQNSGIRVQGNYSRSDLQKGFRIYARTAYGDNNFRYAVFGNNALDEGGLTLEKFKTLTLRAGGNCAFTAKFNDTYWQSLVTNLDCDTKASRPCVVYLNGEYWGLYVLEEDYSNDYYEDHYGVVKEDVVIYKGDAETYSSGYKLDEGKLPEGETDEAYYFNEINEFFNTHSSLENDADYNEFIKLVDPESAMDYFAMQIWINNKWDWPGKNWSMWRTSTYSDNNEYGDGRWRFSFYDVEFGGVSGESDAYTNTAKEDNYKPQGLLDMDTKNPAVLCYAYLMTNEGFRNDYCEKLLALSETNFK